jgi:hypothetical protein
MAVKDAVPGAGRDHLGSICFYLHFAVMIYIVTGWLIPVRAALMVYAFFLPSIAIQWRFNKNSCLLNNAESFLRTGSWRSPANPEEGAWLGTLARDALGIEPTPLQVDLFTYAVMALLWGLGLWHLSGW